MNANQATEPVGNHVFTDSVPYNNRIPTTRVHVSTDQCATCATSLRPGRSGRQCDRCKRRAACRIFS